MWKILWKIFHKNFKLIFRKQNELLEWGYGSALITGHKLHTRLEIILSNLTECNFRGVFPFFTKIWTYFVSKDLKTADFEISESYFQNLLCEVDTRRRNGITMLRLLRRSF